MTEAPTLFDAVLEDVIAENGGRVRESDPATSKAAAKVVKAGTQRGRVLLALAQAADGLNGFEASVRCGINRVHAATTRCEELEELGFARRTGDTRPTDTGAQALVWQVTDSGREMAARMTEAAA